MDISNDKMKNYFEKEYKTENFKINEGASTSKGFCREPKENDEDYIKLKALIDKILSDL